MLGHKSYCNFLKANEFPVKNLKIFITAGWESPLNLNGFQGSWAPTINMTNPSSKSSLPQKIPKDSGPDPNQLPGPNG